MGDPTISKLQSFGFSFWICNTAIWFILFLSFTYKFQPWFLQKAESRLGKWYRTECTANQINCASLVSSTVHAILTFFAGLYIVCIDPNVTWETPESTSNILKWTQSMSLGYFLADYIVLIHTRELGGTVPILAHHTTATIAYLVSLWYNKMGWYSCFRLLSEFSTPFVNLRWILVSIGLKNTRRYKINGVLMTASFFLCRICTFPIYWYYVARVWNTESFNNIPNVLFFFWIVGPLALDILNTFWFYKMFRGMLKALQKSDLTDEQASKTHEERRRKRDQVKDFMKNRYASLKSIVLRRKAIPKRNE
ncbi:Oidioi.mRNA.OKI2018_I69.chr1.g2887.t2.cds [Oikopleura dioica]|uniref:Oidioi.mRNA.OKI2018_I69.chr1.g2887.t2.cds n=1 Tax=Oikopleura dioica TaxID=34765 RepID=A0ABN7SSH0_OIKDI|nr:Oidioi.mRNA.OKI2018_I69.chr1.g2887.t2.cds [Oikopleura dioica]